MVERVAEFLVRGEGGRDMSGLETCSLGVGVVGARALPQTFRAQVAAVVHCLIERGYAIFSGGALGADQFALDAIAERDAFRQSVIFSAWSSVSGFPADIRQTIHRYIAYGGMVQWGEIVSGTGRGAVVAGLLERSVRLVAASCGIVAFLHGESRGTQHTIAEAIRQRRRVIVFLCGGGASLPRQYVGSWVQLGGRSPLAGGYLFLPALHTAQRQPTMEATGAVRLLQEAYHG